MLMNAHRRCPRSAPCGLLLLDLAVSGQLAPRRCCIGESAQPKRIALKRLPHGEDLPVPAYATAHAAGMDVVAAETLTLPPGGRHAVEHIRCCH